MVLQQKTIILVADGDTDYLFIETVMSSDPQMIGLPVKLVRPEDVGLHKRSGGGHKTLLNDALHAAQRAAQGYANGVLVLVDNDGDPRFVFPHDTCVGCRECDARSQLQSVTWGQPFRSDAVILYQALETLVLSARQDFNRLLEDSLYSQALKMALYGDDISPQKTYQEFSKELRYIDITAIKARSYTRLKQVMAQLANT